jgi:hypothetical protein
MSNFGSGLGYRLWHSEIVPIRRRGPEAHHELLTELAFWSIGCAPETVIPRIITANNCHSRGDPLPIRSERIARSYGKLRDGERLPRNSKRDAFAKALALHASGGGMPIPLFDPPPAIDPREERGTGCRPSAMIGQIWSRD